MPDGEYIWVWAHERGALEAEGWTVVADRVTHHALLHGPGYVELLMWRALDLAEGT
jgi:hypothetical protein